MTALTPSQEDIIEQILEEAEINILKEELFDHICTDVEARMTQGNCFEISLQESISSFGKEGLLRTERQTKLFIHQKKYLMKTLSFSFLVLMLFVAFSNLSGQDMPNIKPIDAKISSTFGPKLHPILKKKKMHKGVDFKAPIGTPIKATADGIVTTADKDWKYGNKIEIEHKNGISTFYAHLSNIHVEKGQKIKQGDTIGTVGSTGLSTGPHLHYEVREQNKPVNPEPFLSLK